MGAVTGRSPSPIDGEAGAALDITGVWDRCHPHLRPHDNRLPVREEPRDSVCPRCGSVDSLRVVAHLRFGETAWLERQVAHYCTGCDGYFLAGATVRDLPPRVAGLVPTAVNARLWHVSPTFLNIEPTTRCNFSCWYCVGRHMKQEDIRVEDFARALDNFPNLKHVALVGEGEPLLHKQFFTMARMARERGIEVLMISNGSAFSQSVVKQMCETGISYVAISIDSTDPETFAKSRIDGDLNKIWEGVERLRTYRDDHGYRYPRIAVKGTLFDYSRDQMLPIVEAAFRHGVEMVEGFQPINPKTSYVGWYPRAHVGQLQYADEVAACITRDLERVQARFPGIADYCREHGMDFNSNGWPNRIRPNCDEPWLYSLLSGDVTPCCQIKQVMSPRWNLFRHPVTDILQDPAYEIMRFNLWNGFFKDYCSGCHRTR